MAVVTTQQKVAALYTAIFNRAPDQAGLNFWTAEINAGKSFASVAAGFAQHEVFTTGIGALDNAGYVSALYTNILGSAGDAAGIAYWTARLAAGESKAAIVAEFVNGSLTIDIPALLASGGISAADAAAATIRQQTLTNKADVGIYFANTLGAASNLNPATISTSKAGLEADPIYKASQAAIANVTSTAASVQSAKDGIAVAAGSANPAQALLGQTFTLTTGADTLAGGNGADVFNGSIDGVVAAQNTLGAADKIVGGAGIDTLNVTVNTGASATNGADISGVEVLNVRNIQTAGAGNVVTVDASTVPGLTTVVSDRSTGELTVTNLAAGGTLGLKGNGTTTTGAVVGGYVAAATAANITLDGGVVTATPQLSINGTGLTSATITSTGVANSLATNGVTFTNGAVRAVTVDAQSNVNTGTITGLAVASTVTVKGAGTANIGTLTNVTTLDASANLGGVTANLGAATTLVATGGAGNDVFTTGAALAAGANVNAGAGTADRLVISNTLHLTAAAGALYKGFEQVQVADGVSADVSQLAANNTINTVIIADGAAAGGTSVTGLTAAQAANVQITSANATGVITIGVAGASTAGQIDTVKAALTTSDTAGVAQNIDLTDLSLAGVEKLELTANGTTAANSGTVTLNTAAASSLDSIILKSAGVNTITVTTAGSNLSVDASGSTGNTTINAAGYVSTTGASLKGGAGHDVLIGSAQSDSIVGGAGNDVLATGAATATPGSATATTAATVLTVGVSTASDVLTGGAGNDSFAIGHIDSIANVSSITDLNLGTNVVAGAVDSLWFATAAPLTAATIVTLTAAQQTAVSAAADLGAAVNLVLATASAVNNVAQFTFGTDTYLVTNGVAGGAAYVPAEDNLIKITGVAGVLDASDIHFVAA